MAIMQQRNFSLRDYGDLSLYFVPAQTMSQGDAHISCQAPKSLGNVFFIIRTKCHLHHSCVCSCKNEGCTESLWDLDYYFAL